MDITTNTIISNFTNNIHCVVNLIKELLAERSRDTDEFWILRETNSNEVSAVIQGNMERAIVKMDSFKKGFIHEWVQNYADNFEQEIQLYVSTFDNDINKDLEDTFTLENIALTIYDRLCDYIADNTCLTPVKKL